MGRCARGGRGDAELPAVTVLTTVLVPPHEARPTARVTPTATSSSLISVGLLSRVCPNWSSSSIRVGAGASSVRLPAPPSTIGWGLPVPTQSSHLMLTLRYPER